ncbi:MAG: hypothetical protein GXP39_06905 [Chloroflexi bacterium]|nr:hypothetical protein [Chloroflexota bacterium]
MMELPGAAWVALVLLVSEWIQKYVKSKWVPVVVALLAAVAKFLEVSLGIEVAAASTRSSLMRFLFG